MKYEPSLRRGFLVRRYKRFLADVETTDEGRITIHCPNTGSMKNCAEPGDDVWFSTSDNPARKYAHTWELTRTRRGHYIGINTTRANELVKEAVMEQRIVELSGYQQLRSEVRYGQERSRIDLLLSDASWPDCYVEIKSVTLLEAPLRAGIGYFPDAVSVRGSKHLRELTEMVSRGYRGVLFYCVQHSGIRAVSPAAHIDPRYSEALADAMAKGVEVIAYKTRMSPHGLRIAARVPVVMQPCVMQR